MPSRMFSPSWLIVVTFLKSTMRVSSGAERRASSHSRLSSATHGQTNFPSRTKRHRWFVLNIVIFNISASQVLRAIARLYRGNGGTKMNGTCKLPNQEVVRDRAELRVSEFWVTLRHIVAPYD